MRVARLLGYTMAMALFAPALPAAATTAGSATSYAYLSVSRSGAAVFVDGLIKQSSPSGVIRSPKRTVLVQRLLDGSWQNVISRVTGWDGFFSVGYLSPPSYSYRLVVSPSGSAAGAVSATATSPVLGTVLPAGHTIYAGLTNTSKLTSPSGVFDVWVQSRSFQIDETEHYSDGFSAGTVTWTQFDSSHGANPPQDRSRLTMQSDGNLVLAMSTGAVIWASHTGGTGSHNALYMQNDGNLVIYNPSGQTVWQSRTEHTILVAGTVLRSGQQVVSRYREQFVPQLTRFAMQTNGDLALYYGSTITWHTNTHVAGSRAYLLSNGNLAIFSPSNKLVWQSGTHGTDSSITINTCGEAWIGFRGGTEWDMPPGLRGSCG